MRLNLTSPRADGPAIVLLTGGPGLTPATLEPLPAYLPERPVVTADFTGTRSGSFAGLVETLEKELAQLPFSRFVAVGFSFGGLFAASLAARRRVDVRAFVGIASPLSGEGFGRVDAGLRARQTPAMTAAEEAFKAEPTDARFTDLLVSLVPLYFTAANRDAGARLIASDLTDSRQFIELSLELGTGRIPFAAALLAELSIPKLVIAGAEDGMTPPDVLAADAATAGATFHLVPDASHFIHVEQPAVVARLISSSIN